MAVVLPERSQPSSQDQIVSVSGQGVVGHKISTPWWEGTYEITQGWGATDYTGEPPEDRSGKHYAHWHAGVDIGVPCGTHIHLPADLTLATVRAVDNPSGYGTALVVQVTDHDIWLGHLAQRLVNTGQIVRGGQDLAVSNNTGNSTGCHVHFEVRPRDGKYGTDTDPSELLGTGRQLTSPVPNPLDALGQAVTEAEKRAEQFLIGSGQLALGAVLIASGLLIATLAIQGVGPARLPGAAGAVLRRRPGVARVPDRLPRPAAPARTGELAANTAMDRPRLRY